MQLEKTAAEINMPYIKGNTLCNECFDGYLEDIPAFIHRFPKDLNIIACENAIKASSQLKEQFHIKHAPGYNNLQ